MSIWWVEVVSAVFNKKIIICMHKSINSKERKLTQEMYNLAKNLNALIIMINAGVRNIPIATTQNQKYYIRILTARVNFLKHKGLSVFPWSLSIGLFLLGLLSSVLFPTLTYPLRRGPRPLLSHILNTLTHHRCPCAIFMYIFHLCFNANTKVSLK